MATSPEVQCVRKDCIADPRNPYHQEPHLCFSCGAQWYVTPELLETNLCKVCNWLACPECGACKCSLTKEDRHWVDRVRKYYCQSVEELAAFRDDDLGATSNPSVRAGLGLQLMFCNRWALCELARREQNFGLTILGSRVSRPITADELETFPAPDTSNRGRVTLVCEEVTTLCPVTGQPDFVKVTVSYTPSTLCVETKSLKLYLWSFRNRGVFAEALAVELRDALKAKLLPKSLWVQVAYQSRGGIKLTAEASC